MFYPFINYIYVFFLTLMTATSVYAQPPTVLQGTVSGEDGAPLGGVNVYLPALERGAITDAEGAYEIRNLPATTLGVQFSFVGYRTTVREVTLRESETHTLNVRMVVGVMQGEEVVVTGTPSATDPLRTAQDVDVISSAELEHQRSASLGALVEEAVPGASSVSTGAQAGKPVLRGLTGNRIRVLKDGIAQEYYQFGVRHFPTTSLTEAERVEVVRGASSLLYGSDALGGAINVITKAVPTSRPGQMRFGGSVGGQYYTNNDERSTQVELMGATGSVGFRGGLERRVAGNFTTPGVSTFFETRKGGRFGDPKYTGEIPFTNFSQWTGYSQVGIVGSFGSVQLYGDYWDNEHNFVLPTGGPKGSAANPPVGLGQHLVQANLAAKGNLQVGDLVLKPRLSYQRSVRQSAAPGITLQGMEEDFEWPLDLLRSVYTGRVEAAHAPVYRLNGTFGATVIYQNLHSGAEDGGVELEPSGEIVSGGLFFFEELDYDPLTFSGGARLDFRMQWAEPTAPTVEALGMTNDQKSRRYATFSGALGANYLIAEGLALAGNLSTGFRAPSFFELYANGVHGGVAALQQGNPDLGPERSYSADLGMRLRRSSMEGELVVYQNRIDDYIYLANTGELTADEVPIYASAQTDAVIYGVEAVVETALRSWMKVGGEAAFLGSEGDDLQANEEGERNLPLIPPNRVSGFGRVSVPSWGRLENPFLQLKLRHVFGKDAAGRYEPFSQFDTPVGPPPFGTASTRAYTLVDLEAGATIEVGFSSVILALGVKNALDEAYRSFLDTYKGYAMSPGRNVYVKATLPFSTVLER